MLRNDAMDRFMSVGASGWSKEAGVEDRSDSLVGQPKVLDTWKRRAFGEISR
ncbi:MAG: hypothetical protein V2I43_14380 [Parvularcula sp.]|nr:hypothetical protein [Parvularcula sp.]